MSSRQPLAAQAAGSSDPADNHHADAPVIVALVGNPNTGKTALFNALTGFRRHVANYAGVTVDVARGPIRRARRPLMLVDLPGTYSLVAASPDEKILCDALAGRLPGQPAPVAIIAVVDASNPTRNLYLISQLLEIGKPLVIALNMIDIAEARGIVIDAGELSRRLGVPVVPVVAVRPKTVPPLVRAVEETLGAPAPSPAIPPPQGTTSARGRLACTSPEPPTPDEVQARYAWASRVLDGVAVRHRPSGSTWSERLDRVLTHRVYGALALALVLYALFYAIYAGAAPLMDLVDDGINLVGRAAEALLPAGFARSLVIDGLLAGVGGVVAFLPQILILFLFIAVLEDCGYLARAAFMVDRLMRPLGLSGRAFIPLLSAFACAVPAIMGTRAIADRRERVITILLAPFMSCSARLPIYILLIGAFVPPRQWLGGWVRLDALVMLAMYLVGVVVAIPVALVLRHTVLAGPDPTFLMELPSYKRPGLRTVVQRMTHAGRSFLARAGTIILLVNLVVWALGYFPRDPRVLRQVEQQRLAADWDGATFESQLAGAYLRDSYLGRLGRAIEPAIRPLGWDWRIGIGVIASFPAREVIIATLGTVANLGADADVETGSLRDAVRRMTHHDTGRPLFTLPVALSLMVFFALCAQCASTLVVIGRETGSWAWPVASFVGMTTLAYAAAWAVSATASACGL
ncbi:MAG: ferrous iron transporter B [Planctomycetota bacterium]